MSQRKLGKTQRAAAAKAGVSERTARRIERGEAGAGASPRHNDHHSRQAAQDRRGGLRNTRRMRILFASHHPLRELFAHAAQALAP